MEIMVDHAIILNPIAGKGKKATGSIEDAKKYLDELNVSYKIFETNKQYMFVFDKIV